MQLIENALAAKKTNFILIGEAGCGKSEIALNLAKFLAKNTDKKVHLFDMDMTKPLFRSRDLLESGELSNVSIHFEEQFFDAPTVVGGVRELLADPDSIVVMDVGGDDIGARSIGGFMLGVDKKSLCVLYVLNYYRPFCQDIDHIDKFLAEILAVSHLSLDDIHFVDNPNAGLTTTIDEVVEGVSKMDEIISEYREIEMIVVHEGFYESVKNKLPKEKIMPIHLFLTYEWLRN
ncbi:MAG: ATP-binding protein [Pseudobutyrivibrio sp.]|nr:ATP-binding protein [Pseudobutyrivibrio sp.]